MRAILVALAMLPWFAGLFVVGPILGAAVAAISVRYLFSER